MSEKCLPRNNMYLFQPMNYYYLFTRGILEGKSTIDRLWLWEKL